MLLVTVTVGSGSDRRSRYSTAAVATAFKSLVDQVLDPCVFKRWHKGLNQQPGVGECGRYRSRTVSSGTTAHIHHCHAPEIRSSLKVCALLETLSFRCGKGLAETSKA